ncbi:dTDP-4-dehydrorhamnose reductase [Pseudomonas sp. 13B_3.2_Bac1]|uniref:dTDP-4-dehydrorhamnose reductase n=1 Tax=Pseudomonas sp. 13B_3.2_Bac1 TaxID=2971623 RepID=UPI0021C6E2ED|nr:dTDP-4-dehydrorhamnose reductase [Pseudomonas sp. 13B_3.2_Bac1]MCU1772405.1 dTDP-4-dehydrorhamnose reductase [Pseudomonas sp. 13B_3.2_Bac1]
MKILLFGKNGQIGWELQRALAPLGELVAYGHNAAQGLAVDLADAEALRAVVRAVEPDLIVNAAAYTAVDKAESDKEKVDRVNAQACEIMAQEAKALGAWFVHYSTDYVFSGQGCEPWKETDLVAPLNQYGRSKAAGEQAIIQSGCQYLIFRTSWVYAQRGNNFAKTMLRLARERKELNVVSDQVGAPTAADLIADVTVLAVQKALVNSDLIGIYHLAAEGETTWYSYASYIFDFARENGEDLVVSTVNPVDSSSYPTPARRPMNSRLDTRKLRERFSVHLPSWQSGLDRVLGEILGK